MLIGIERLRLELHLLKVDCIKIEASDIGVVHRAVIDAELTEIACHCPLSSTRDIGDDSTLGKLYASGNVEVVKDVESLQYGLLRAVELWC